MDRFARYYLPEVVKLMGTYAALEQNGVRGENAAQICLLYTSDAADE